MYFVITLSSFLICCDRNKSIIQSQRHCATFKIFYQILSYDAIFLEETILCFNEGALEDSLRRSWRKEGHSQLLLFKFH